MKGDRSGEGDGPILRGDAAPESQERKKVGDRGNSERMACPGGRGRENPGESSPSQCATELHEPTRGKDFPVEERGSFTNQRNRIEERSKKQLRGKSEEAGAVMNEEKGE